MPHGSFPSGFCALHTQKYGCLYSTEVTSLHFTTQEMDRMNSPPLCFCDDSPPVYLGNGFPRYYSLTGSSHCLSHCKTKLSISPHLATYDLLCQYHHIYINIISCFSDRRSEHFVVICDVFYCYCPTCTFTFTC